jgi:hypothetical protein
VDNLAHHAAKNKSPRFSPGGALCAEPHGGYDHCSVETVADIRQFLDRRSFDNETLRMMGDAYDAALRELHDRTQPLRSEKSPRASSILWRRESAIHCGQRGGRSKN